MMSRGFALALLLSIPAVGVAKTERSIILTEAQVAEIQTALGYSTLLQFDSRPSSVVLGDQDAFKIEYVGNSLTLKPLIYGARTNLFVFTEYEKFSFRLIAGKSEAADYLVKVKRRDSKPALASELGGSPALSNTMVEVPLYKRASCNNVSFGVNSVSYPKDKPWLLINFSLSLLRARELGDISFTAEDFAVSENKKPSLIETLYLQKLSLTPDGTPVHGSILVSHANSKLRIGTRVVFAPTALAGSKCFPLSIPLDVGKGKK